MTVRKKYGAIAALAVYLAAVILLCLIRPDSLPQVQMSLFGIPTDKVVHFLFFLPYPVLTWLALNEAGHSRKRKLLTAILIFLSGTAIAAGTEVLQSLTDYRDSDITDLIADCIGLMTGIAIICILSLSLQRRIK